MTCSDFDLCSDCESLPVPVHPLAHHMLKMRTLAPVSPRSPANYRGGVSIQPVSQAQVESRLPTPASSQAGLVFTSMPPSTSETATELPTADLMSFTEKSEVEEPLRTPTLPQTNLAGSLMPDINVLVESPVESHSPPVEPAAPAPIEPESTPTRATTPEVTGAFRSPVPHVQDVAKESWQMWPEMREMLNDMIHSVPATTAASTPVIVSSEIGTSIATPSDFASIADDAAPASVADLEVSQATIAPSPAPSSVGGYDLLMTPEPQLAALRAAYVADNNIPDGQVFPPGAEFVKSWKMLNDGSRDWPETTQLLWAAGDKLTEQAAVRVGRVSGGEEVDIWTGEMKVCCPSSGVSTSNRIVSGPRCSRKIRLLLQIERWARQPVWSEPLGRVCTSYSVTRIVLTF